MEANGVFTPPGQEFRVGRQKKKKRLGASSVGRKRLGRHTSTWTSDGKREVREVGRRLQERTREERSGKKEVRKKHDFKGSHLSVMIDKAFY